MPPRVPGAIPALRLIPREDQPAAAPPPSADDDALVAAVRRGDRAIAAAFCQRIWPQVDRTLGRLLGRGDPDRDDVGQLALIELVKSIGRYRGDCSLDTWVQTVTSHMVFKHIRRRRLERQVFTNLLADDETEIAAPSLVVHGERREMSRDLLARVAALLGTINADRAWAFVLHDVLGYDLREIADMTKTSPAAAQSRLSRGRRDLHELIAGDAALAQLMSELEGRL